MGSRERRKGWNSAFAREQVLLEEGGQRQTHRTVYVKMMWVLWTGNLDMPTQTHVDTNPQSDGIWRGGLEVLMAVPPLVGFML